MFGYICKNIFNGIDTLRRDQILKYSYSLNEHCDGTRCKIINKLITGDYCLAPPMHCSLENLQYKINLKEDRGKIKW